MRHFRSERRRGSLYLAAALLPFWPLELKRRRARDQNPVHFLWEKGSFLFFPFKTCVKIFRGAPPAYQGLGYKRPYTGRARHSKIFFQTRTISTVTTFLTFKLLRLKRNRRSCISHYWVLALDLCEQSFHTPTCVSKNETLLRDEESTHLQLKGTHLFPPRKHERGSHEDLHWPAQPYAVQSAAVLSPRHPPLFSQCIDFEGRAAALLHASGVYCRHQLPILRCPTERSTATKDDTGISRRPTAHTTHQLCISLSFYLRVFEDTEPPTTDTRIRLEKLRYF